MTRILVVLVALSGRALATGICENTPLHVDAPALFSEATSSFAVPSHQDWCEETADMSESRGTVSFVQLLATDGSQLATLSAETGKNADRLTAAIGAFGAFSAANLATELSQRGYAPLVTRSDRGCTARVRWTPAPKEKVNGFPASTMQVEIVRAGKRLLRLKLDLGATQRKDAAVVRASFLAKSRAVALFAIVPTCSGGPPPGYFSPDDGGDCYEQDLIVTKLLTQPALAACFKTP